MICLYERARLATGELLQPDEIITGIIFDSEQNPGVSGRDTRLLPLCGIFDVMKKGFVPLVFIQWSLSFELSMSLMARCVRMSCRRDERGMYTVLIHVLCQHCLAGHMNLYGWCTLWVFRGCTTSGPTTFSYEHHFCDTCGDIRCNLWLCHCLIRLFVIFVGLCF